MISISFSGFLHAHLQPWLYPAEVCVDLIARQGRIETDGRRSAPPAFVLEDLRYQVSSTGCEFRLLIPFHDHFIVAVYRCVFAVVEMTPPAIQNIDWRVFIIFAIFNACWVPIVYFVRKFPSLQ